MAHLELGISVSRPLGTAPTTWRATADETPRRLEQSWNVSTCDSQAPGAGRSSNTFWHETGRKGESGSNRLWKGRGPCGNASTSRFGGRGLRSEEHTSELQSRLHLVCR